MKTSKSYQLSSHMAIDSITTRINLVSPFLRPTVCAPIISPIKITHSQSSHIHLIESLQHKNKRCYRLRIFHSKIHIFSHKLTILRPIPFKKKTILFFFLLINLFWLKFKINPLNFIIINFSPLTLTLLY